MINQDTQIFATTMEGRSDGRQRHNEGGFTATLAATNQLTRKRLFRLPLSLMAIQRIAADEKTRDYSKVPG